MKPSRILILSYHSPPSNAVGGLRWWGISKYLARLGWEVTILSSGEEFHLETPPGVHTVRVKARTTLKDRYQSWRIRAAMKSTSRESTSLGPPAKKAAQVARNSWLRREAAALLGFPDDSRGWLVRGCRAALALVRRDPPVIVVSSGPPHALHVIGRIAARVCGAAHVMDYRDPWTAGSKMQELLSDQVLAAVERRLVERAEAVVAVTPEIASIIARRFARHDVHWISNGVDAEGLPRAKQMSGLAAEFVHVGNLYFNRDPAVLVAAFRRYVTSHETGMAVGRLRFIGSVEEPYLTTLRTLSEDAALRENLTLEKPVSRTEALQVVAGASLAIVLAPGQESMVPAKLYESVAMGVPTLVVAEAGSASASAAARVGAAWCAPDDEAGIAATMRLAASGGIRNAPTEFPFKHEEIAALTGQLLLDVLAKRRS